MPGPAGESEPGDAELIEQAGQGGQPGQSGQSGQEAAADEHGDGAQPEPAAGDATDTPAQPGGGAAAQPPASRSASVATTGSISGTVSFTGRSAVSKKTVITAKLSYKFDGIWFMVDQQALAAVTRSYTFTGLEPGDYSLKFSASAPCTLPKLKPGAAARAAEDFACGYPDTWWNSHSSAVTATPIALAAGDKLTGYNASFDTNHLDVKRGHKFFTEIDWMYKKGISTGVAGTNGNIYQSRVAVSRGAMAAFMYRAAGKPAVKLPQKPTFSDVPKNHKFYREIEWMAQKGITNGTKRAGGTRSYDPGKGVTRQAMAAFLYRFKGGKPVAASGATTFVDVKKWQPFAKEIAWLSATGITNGVKVSGGLAYKPKSYVSREAMAAFLYRAAKL